MSDTKKCSYCAKDIKAETVICRFCKADLNTGKPDTSEKGESSRGRISNRMKMTCGILILLLGIIFWVCSTYPTHFLRAMSIKNGSSLESGQIFSNHLIFLEQFAAP